MSRPNAALQYHPEGFEMTGPKPMGRQSAGRGFLEGFVRHAGVEAVVGYGDGRAAQAFERTVRAMGGRAPVAWATAAAPGPAAAAGALHLAGPGLGEFAWLRRAAGQRAYSLTGVTHTVASARAMDGITALLTAPVQAWDALICTSRSVRAMVDVLLADQAEYLAARLGTTAPAPRPQLPVIPLGVDVEAFTPDIEHRTALRRRLQVGDDEVLFLMAGRLSYHAKAHPHPMYVALQRAAERTGARPHLLLASWFANEGQERVFKEGAAELCPDVRVHVLDGREQGVWPRVWRAADAYTLLSDNIQESFGLAPVEAMAAGLPVVGSDWDGLRDTIVHGETGFLAASIVPPNGAGDALARLHATEAQTYDQYVGAVAQSTAVDIGQATDGYAALLADPGLRRRMGEAGRRRAQDLFDWSVVIPQYQALWAELAERRAKAPESAPPRPGRPVDPARSDPYRHFAAHASRALAAGDRLEPAPDLERELLALTARTGGATIPAVLATGADLRALVARLGPGVTFGELLAGNSAPQQRARTARTVAWLLKFDLIRVVPAGSASAAATRA